MPSIAPKNNVSPPKLNRRVRAFLLRWHKRIGLACLAVFLLVSVTGFLLNHTAELSLGKTQITHSALLRHYGFKPPSITSYSLGSEWLSDLGGDHLYLNDNELAYCQGALVGAVSLPQFSVAACVNELLLLTPEGEVVEHIGAVYGVPSPVESLGLCGERLCLRSSGRVYLADVQQLQWAEYDGEGFVPTVPAALPAQYARALRTQALGSGLDLERVILDLHSGRILGLAGVWIVDLAALGLILLSLSGFWMWYQQVSRRR